MLKRFVILGVFAAMLSFAPRAEAIPITGSIDFVGLADPTGGVGNKWSAGTTGINFVGIVQALNGSGAYAAVPDFTQPVSFSNFTFNPFPGAGVNPLWSFSVAGTTYSFNLGAVTAFGYSTAINALGAFALSGTGTLNISGGLYTPTPGTFSFSSQNSSSNTATRFSFSANGTAVPPIPEPGSMLLLGTGLVGLASTARRQWAKRNRNLL
jgi:hypothetical protein